MVDAGANAGTNLENGAIGLCRNSILHLHGFHGDDSIALLDLLSVDDRPEGDDIARFKTVDVVDLLTDDEVIFAECRLH